MSEAEATISRIKGHSNIGFMITDKRTKILRTNYVNENASKGELLRNNLPLLAKKAEDLVRDLEPTNELKFLRIKTKTIEFMVAPDDDQYVFTVYRFDENREEEL